jgi:hypothetical protein
MSRIPHFLHNRLIDGGQLVNLTHRPHFTPRNIFWYSFLFWASGSLVVKALNYKLEGRGFETRRGEILNLPNPSGLAMRFTQPLTEISTGNIKKNKVKCG